MHFLYPPLHFLFHLFAIKGNSMRVDLRSDTVTKPSPEMYKAMMEAVVGDDVFGEDEAINELETKTAAWFGMEAGIYCPSGTMTNQLAIKCHTQPGDEVICDESSHIYQYEGGGIGFNSGCSVKLLNGDHGRISANQVVQSINKKDDIHKANSRMVSLENTSNRGGGACYDWEEIRKIKNVCVANELSLHLDGARVWNAIVANNENPVWYGESFDSISVCFSKSLGAPVGSVLLGNKNLIQKARRFRKIFGGGMRQAGILAAACTYALEHNIKRLQIDHQYALVISKALEQKHFVKRVLPVSTNIIIFETHTTEQTTVFVKIMLSKDIHLFAMAPNRVRIVLHLDVSSAMVDYMLAQLNRI